MPRSGVSLEQKQRWMREGHSRTTLQEPDPLCHVDIAERHYTVSEIAGMWNLGPDAVRRMFEAEPGVLVLGANGTSRGKRCYTTLRIPEQVAQRVYRRQLRR